MITSPLPNWDDKPLLSFDALIQAEIALKSLSINMRHILELQKRTITDEELKMWAEKIARFERAETQIAALRRFLAKNGAMADMMMEDNSFETPADEAEQQR